ncbi:hypothetical protein PG990_014802 [Apiospora arundinis]|uniref:C6 finger domain n=1 Tax=Apiospora arundinis TaxID=335852 RepID=A0ABR2HK74_9PEZI
MHSGSESSPQASSPLPLRFCGICHKPFLKESSYRRHVLYCRRAQSRPQTRAKACRACNLAKVKCTLQPQCLRCNNKGLDCVYDTTAAPVSTTTKDVQTSSPSVSLSGGAMTGTLEDWCEFDVASDADEAEATQPTLDWSAFELPTNQSYSDTPKDSVPHLTGPAMGIMSHNAALADSSRYSPYTDGFIANCDPQHLLADGSGPSRQTVLGDGQAIAIARPTHVSEPPDSSFLSQISMSDPVAHCTANVIMQLLRAFPQMMLRRETFPPFIHAHWHRSLHTNATEPALPTPLMGCMGIAQVFASPNLETRPFLWRSIQTEQRSALEKSKQRLLSKQELLATIQAQLIYIMMRVIDKSPTTPGMNHEMLVIYQSLCESFKDLCNQPFFQDERQYPSSYWEDWVFSESRRRTVVVWLLIAHLVQVKIGVLCDSFDGFREIPLPACRALWDARTRQDWQMEYEIYKTMPRGGLNLFGDLIDACKQSDFGPNKLKLDVWNSTVDNLGILLNLAASIF